MTPSVWWSRSRWERPMQSPRAHHPHLHPSARGSARSHTWGVHTSCPPSPGNCQGHPGAGGPGVRDGVDWTGRGSCLEQSLNSGSLFGSCERPWLWNRWVSPRRSAGQTAAGHGRPRRHRPPLCWGNVKPWRKKITRTCNTGPYALPRVCFLLQPPLLQGLCWPLSSGRCYLPVPQFLHP